MKSYSIITQNDSLFRGCIVEETNMQTANGAKTSGRSAFTLMGKQVSMPASTWDIPRQAVDPLALAQVRISCAPLGSDEVCRVCRRTDHSALYLGNFSYMCPVDYLATRRPPMILDRCRCAFVTIAPAGHDGLQEVQCTEYALGADEPFCAQHSAASTVRAFSIGCSVASPYNAVVVFGDVYTRKDLHDTEQWMSSNPVRKFWFPTLTELGYVACVFDAESRIQMKRGTKVMWSVGTQDQLADLLAMCPADYKLAVLGVRADGSPPACVQNTRHTWIWLPAEAGDAVRAAYRRNLVSIFGSSRDMERL